MYQSKKYNKQHTEQIKKKMFHSNMLLIFELVISNAAKKNINKKVTDRLLI